MTKREGAFLVIIFFLLNIIAGMICWAWQQKKNEEYLIERFTMQLVEQRQQIADLNHEMNIMQSDLARTGIYDKE